MPAGSYSVRAVLSADVGPYLAAMGKAETASLLVGQALLKTQAKASAFGTALGKASQMKSWRYLSTGILAVGAAFAAATGKMVAESAKYDKAISNIKATGEGARAVIGQLSDAAIKAGQDTAWSASEAAGGIENLLKAGVSASDVLKGSLVGSLSLASAGELDVANAAEIASSAMTQFGLSGDKVTHIADVLAAGAGKAQGNVRQLAQGLKQSGTVAAQFGLSLEDTVGSLAAFASYGMLGSDAGTSFKSMLLRLARPAGEAKDLMQQLGINVYDTNGQFVGITGVADQLKTSLSGLTEEQRNAALATIFGTDAIRAANILYKEGGDGIKGWIDKVNDSGFAAEVARERLNNLQGDLKILAGSWETMFIKLGQSGQSPLRELVQELTNLINWISSLDAGAQSAILKTAGALAAMALTVGGVMKLTTAISSFHAAITSLRGIKAVDASLAFLGRRMRGLTKAAVAATAALVALNAVGKLTNLADNTTVEQYENQLLRLASGGDAAAKSLDEMYSMFGRAQNAAGPARLANDLGDALERVADPGTLAKMGQTLSGIIGVEDELTRWQKQLGKMDQALASMDTETAARAFRNLAESQAAAGLTTEQLVGLFPQYQAGLVEEANQLGVTSLAAADYAAWMGGQVPTAIASAREAAAQNAQAQAQMSNAFDESAQAASAAVDAMREYASQQLKISGSAIGVEQAIADATAAVKSNGKNLDITTAKGRANQSALNDIATAAHAYSQSLREAGKSEGEVARATSRARTQFIATAQKMGMSRQAAIALASAYGLDADKVAHLTSKLKGVPKETKAKIKSEFNRRGVDSAINSLNNVRGKTVTVTTVHRHLVQRVSQGQRFVATGGYITGPGTGTSDSIPAWLSNGEYVIKAAAVKRLGVPLLNMLNRGLMPRFAQGGQVTNTSQRTVDNSVRVGAVTIDVNNLAELKQATDWANAMNQMPRLARQGVN